MDEDMILPDDFEATPAPEAEVEQEQPAETLTEVEDTKPTEVAAEPSESPKLKIKYNHEEKEISLEEAATLAQKGLNYDKGIERARQEAAQQARDAWIAEQGYAWNGRPITTEAEYKQATAEKELMDKYQDQGLPDEVVKELVENRKFREQYQTQQKELEAKQRENDHYNEFVAQFPDVDPKTIKPETWQRVADGVPLKYAYMEQERADLLTKVKVVEQNQKNQQRAPIGSVTSHGSNEVASEDDFIRGFDSV